MTLNNRHIKTTSFTPSPAHTALKKIFKVVVILIASVVGLTIWAVVKPIFRGLGWIISAVTTIAILYWIGAVGSTLFIAPFLHTGSFNILH